MRYVHKLRKVCIKSNGHSATSILTMFLPQLTTNLELTPKLCGQELRLAIAIWILILIKMPLPCKHNSRSGSRSGSTYPDCNPENFVPCKWSITHSGLKFHSGLKCRFHSGLKRHVKAVRVSFRIEKQLGEINSRN